MSSDEESGSEGGASNSTDDEFKDKHRCTDIPCSIIFVPSVILFIGIFVWACINGNTDKITHGISYDGQICGVSPKVSGKPFLYYCPKVFNTQGDLSVDLDYPVCIEECPTGSWDAAANLTVTTPDVISVCPLITAYSTTQISGRYCLPSKSMSTEARAEVFRAMSDVHDQLSSDFGSIIECWPIMVFTVLVATILGYIYLFLLRMLARLVVWICFLTATLALVGFGIYLWQNGEVELDAELHAGPSPKKVIAIILWILAFGVACLACCFTGSVELSTACVQTGTVVIWKMPLLLLSPLIKALVKAVLTFAFIVGFVHLWATGDIHGKGSSRQVTFQAYQWLAMVFYIICSYWILAFVSALYQFAVAYAVAKYYLTAPDEEGDRDVDCFAVAEGVGVGLAKHTGSLAYGSFVIAVFEVFQRFLEWAEAKNQVEGNNKVVSCILGTCMCCCKCVEGIITFINKNAYIDIATTSSNFCEAVRNVMHIVIDNGAAMAILNGATVVFQVVGMVTITVLCAFMANTMLTHKVWGIAAGSPTLATGVAAVLALIVAWAFMSVFDVTTDTLLICYAEDKRLHGGHAVTAPEDMRKLYEKAELKARELKTKSEAPQEPKKSPKFGRPPRGTNR